MSSHSAGSSRGGSAPGGARIRALVADDEPRARQFLEKLLGENSEIEVVGVAHGGAEALALSAELNPDVAFLDIHMPDLSGLEVARHLKGDDAPIVVFVTAYDQHAIEAFELAALDYVLKPIRRERLAETVQRVTRELGSPRGGVDGESLAPGHAGRSHAARDDRRMRRQTAVRGENPARLHHPVEVVGRRLPADEDDVLPGLASLFRRVGVEDDSARGSAR